MSFTADQLEKSRLGRLLVNRGFITEEQLLAALAIQQQSGTKLGMVLVAQGWISESDLERSLKRQRRYRYTAALVTMVAAPLQPMLAFGASLPAAASVIPTSQTQQQDRESLANRMQALSEEEMASVSGAGLDDLFAQFDQVQSVFDQDGKTPEGVEGIKILATTMVPVFNSLDADVTVEGVEYDDSKPRYHIYEDGRVQMALPTKIQRISLNNLRVAGSSAPAFGDVTLSDISFGNNSTITIKAH